VNGIPLKKRPAKTVFEQPRYIIEVLSSNAHGSGDPFSLWNEMWVEFSSPPAPLRGEETVAL
jgi:hypothetical protein